MNVKQAEELPLYLTLKGVAELLKVKPRTIYAWVSDHRIPFERKGSLLRSRLDAVLAWNEPTQQRPREQIAEHLRSRISRSLFVATVGH